MNNWSVCKPNFTIQSARVSLWYEHEKNFQYFTAWLHVWFAHSTVSMCKVRKCRMQVKEIALQYRFENITEAWNSTGQEAQKGKPEFQVSVKLDLSDNYMIYMQMNFMNRHTYTNMKRLFSDMCKGKRAYGTLHIWNILVLLHFCYHVLENIPYLPACKTTLI